MIVKGSGVSKIERKICSRLRDFQICQISEHKRSVLSETKR